VSENIDGTWTCDEPTTCFGYLVPEAAVNSIIESCLAHNEEFEGFDRQEINMKLNEAQEEEYRIKAIGSSKIKEHKEDRSLRDCFIYLIRDTPRGLHKIGRAASVPKRFEQLKTANAGIELVASYKGIERDEKVLHGFFLDQQVSGEWFMLDDEHIEFIKNYFNQKRA
jgi:hypothetical protein